MTAELADPAPRIVEATWALVLAEPGCDPSVRRIATAAEVNQAMVGYYFQSKDGLLEKMFFTYAKPLAQARMNGLAALRGKDLTLENVLAAWFAPVLDRTAGLRLTALSRMLGSHHAVLYKRLFSEANEDSARSFVDALCALMPAMSREAVVCRFYATAVAVASSDEPFALSGMKALAGDDREIDSHRYMAELRSFAIAGFRACINRAEGIA